MSVAFSSNFPTSISHFRGMTTLIKNGSLPFSASALSRPRGAAIADPWSASFHRCTAPNEITTPSDSPYRHGHKHLSLCLFLLPHLFHEVPFIRYPVPVTLRSSIPRTVSGHRLQNKASTHCGKRFGWALTTSVIIDPPPPPKLWLKI